MTCINFKYSVPECNTVRNVSAQLGEGFQSDYPIYPLLDEHERPAPTAIQFRVVQPFPRQAIQQGPIAVPQYAPASRASRVQPLKARRKKVSAAERAPTLETPLSELPNSKVSDPLEEIARYVQRPVNVRRMEAAIAGRVKRPLNQFLLYRKAYLSTLDKADMRSASIIIGESWAIEGEVLRNFFTGLASTEALLHELAFPSYKYAPRQPPTKSSKTRKSWILMNRGD